MYVTRGSNKYSSSLRSVERSSGALSACCIASIHRCYNILAHVLMPAAVACGVLLAAAGGARGIDSSIDVACDSCVVASRDEVMGVRLYLHT